MLGLRCFTGLFLYSPCAIHMDLPPCSYDCAYCFARWKRGKSAEAFTQRTKAGWLQYLRTRTRWLGWFIRHKKLVCCSNTSDPFSGVHKYARPLMEACLEYGLPLTYQTKGGAEALAWAKQAPKSAWSVTITSDDPKLQGGCEGVAPPVTQRMKLVEELRALGHEVCIGFVPYVKPWWRDLPKFLRWAEGLGCSGLVAWPLNAPAPIKTWTSAGAYTRLLPLLAMRKSGTLDVPDPEKEFATSLPVCSDYRNFADYWDAGLKVYDRSAAIPTICHFVASKKPHTQVRFAEALEFWRPHMPNIPGEARDYLRGIAYVKDLKAEGILTEPKTFEAMLSGYWDFDKKPTDFWQYLDVLQENGRDVLDAEGHAVAVVKGG